MRKTFIHIVIGIIIGLSSQYFVDYIYAQMRRGGLTPELPFVHTDHKGELRKVDVYIIPFVGLSDSVAAELSGYLSSTLGIVVKSTGCLALPENAYDSNRKQYVAEEFYNPIVQYSRQLGDSKPETLFIGVLANDMYPRGANWNYCFALNFSNRISVIATDRLVPYGVLDEQHAQKLFGERIVKLFKREIGLQFYRHELSPNPKSLLYSPLMSLDDIDRMTMDY